MPVLFESAHAHTAYLSLAALGWKSCTHALPAAGDANVTRVFVAQPHAYERMPAHFHVGHTQPKTSAFAAARAPLLCLRFHTQARLLPLMRCCCAPAASAMRDPLTVMSPSRTAPLSPARHGAHVVRERMTGGGTVAAAAHGSHGHSRDKAAACGGGGGWEGGGRLGGASLAAERGWSVGCAHPAHSTQAASQGSSLAALPEAARGARGSIASIGRWGGPSGSCKVGASLAASSTVAASPSQHRPCGAGWGTQQPVPLLPSDVRAGLLFSDPSQPPPDALVSRAASGATAAAPSFPCSSTSFAAPSSPARVSPTPLLPPSITSSLAYTADTVPLPPLPPHSRSATLPARSHISASSATAWSAPDLSSSGSMLSGTAPAPSCTQSSSLQAGAAAVTPSCTAPYAYSHAPSATSASTAGAATARPPSPSWPPTSSHAHAGSCRRSSNGSTAAVDKRAGVRGAISAIERALALPTPPPQPHPHAWVTGRHPSPASLTRATSTPSAASTPYDHSSSWGGARAAAPHAHALAHSHSSGLAELGCRPAGSAVGQDALGVGAPSGHADSSGRSFKFSDLPPQHPALSQLGGGSSAGAAGGGAGAKGVGSSSRSARGSSLDGRGPRLWGEGGAGGSMLPAARAGGGWGAPPVDENAEYRAGVLSLRSAASANQLAFDSFQVCVCACVCACLHQTDGAVASCWQPSRFCCRRVRCPEPLQFGEGSRCEVHHMASTYMLIETARANKLGFAPKKKQREL